MRRRVGGEGEGNLVSKHEILAAPTTGLARNVRHTGAAKKHVSVIQHLPSLVTRSRRPEDSRKGGGEEGVGQMDYVQHRQNQSVQATCGDYVQVCVHCGNAFN